MSDTNAPDLRASTPGWKISSSSCEISPLEAACRRIRAVKQDGHFRNNGLASLIALEGDDHLKQPVRLRLVNGIIVGVALVFVAEQVAEIARFRALDEFVGQRKFRRHQAGVHHWPLQPARHFNRSE